MRITHALALLRPAAAVTGLGLALVFAAVSAQADQVTSAADDGSPGTLRTVIGAAAPGATIDFAPALDGMTITLTSRIEVATNLTITGLGQDRLTISGGGANRVFRLSSGSLLIQDLTIAKGLAEGVNGGASESGGGGGGGSAFGGAIYQDGGSLHLQRVLFDGNQALGGHGGRGGLLGAGSLPGVGGPAAGGLGSTGSAGTSATGTTGGTGGQGAIVAGLDALAMPGGGPLPNPGGDPSRVLGGGGGGGCAYGGAIYVAAGTLVLELCTFEKNQARHGNRGWNNLNEPIDVASPNPRYITNGSAVHASAGYTVIDGVTVGASRRANQHSHLLWPSNPSAQPEGTYEFFPDLNSVAITPSSAPLAAPHPQISTLGHPRLPPRYRNERFDGTPNTGTTVTDLLSRLQGFGVVDADTPVAAMGVAVVGVDDDHGAWQFDVDGSGTWAALEDVSETSALLLPPAALVRFFPRPGFETDDEPEPFLAFRAWDDAGNAPLQGTRADTTANGAGTTFSAEIASVFQSVEESLRIPASWLEVEQTHPNGYELDEDSIPQDRALLMANDWYRTGRVSAPFTIVGVGGVWAAGATVSSRHATILYDTNGQVPGIAALGVLQHAMDIPAVVREKGGVSQEIYNANVVRHGTQRANAGPDLHTVAEDSTSNLLTVLDNDDDGLGGSAVLVAVMPSSRGASVTVDGDQASYTPPADFNGPDSFFYLVSSVDALRWAVGRVDILIEERNDAPVFTLGAPPPAVDQDMGPQVVPGMISDAATVGGITFDPVDEGFIPPTASTFGPDEARQAIASVDVQVTINTGNLAFTTGPSIDPVTGDLTYESAPGTAGTATLTVRVIDSGPTGTGHENTSASQTFPLVVNDTEPPVITGMTARRSLLWPPRRGMMPVALNVTATDNVGPITYEVTVYANEDEGTAPYAPDAQLPSTPATLRLRAERQWPGTGRIYVIAVRALDGAGNASDVATTSVLVPTFPTATGIMALKSAAALAEQECRDNLGAAPSTGTWYPLLP